MATDRLERIREKMYDANAPMERSDMRWLIDEIEGLWKAAHDAGAIMQRLRRENVQLQRTADDAQAETDDLVTALRNILGECTHPRAAYGKRVNEMCRVALAPYGEGE